MRIKARGGIKMLRGTPSTSAPAVQGHNGPVLAGPVASVLVNIDLPERTAKPSISLLSLYGARGIAQPLSFFGSTKGHLNQPCVKRQPSIIRREVRGNVEGERLCTKKVLKTTRLFFPTYSNDLRHRVAMRTERRRVFLFFLTMVIFKCRQLFHGK
jgi:hypothetical protein